MKSNRFHTTNRTSYEIHLISWNSPDFIKIYRILEDISESNRISYEIHLILLISCGFHVKSTRFHCNFMKSNTIYQKQQRFQRTSWNPTGFYWITMQISMWISFVDFMDFMKDQDKVRDLTWITCFTDFRWISPEIHWVSFADFMKSGGFHMKSCCFQRYPLKFCGF